MDLLWKQRQAALRRSRCSTSASQHSDCSSGFIRAATAEDVELGEHLQDGRAKAPSKGMVVAFQVCRHSLQAAQTRRPGMGVLLPWSGLC